MRSTILRNLRPLGRALHTGPIPHATASRFNSRLGLALGASAVTIAYLSWRVAGPERSVALDGRKMRSRWDDDPIKEETVPEEPTETSEEDYKSAAFNPVTGEINWDCPCLGGMAHGPCGEQFREAFSCFVYSEQEPKGVDCVEKFRAMQDCFRLHPDVYGEEIDDEDDDVEGEKSTPPEADSADTSADAPSPDSSHPTATLSEPSPSSPTESTDTTTSTST
ncbi:hypothetical protein BOTBODRAFT_182799 [Botryobasidium botryosum FD-172 SS1]|uniref:Mitochondrial intermembrane space import and assembly protein 40 n=1 Tax=Botryobasidium botryosum (strain FD-172 SS1) TaxID=930990 RepID=A0A067NCH1_BOTB1|nr:hypothetical protein BOTBODRAFT_182799 [Botryobasidium botryosum FD-172 SS1]